MSARRTYYFDFTTRPSRSPTTHQIHIFYVVAMGRDLPGNNEEHSSSHHYPSFLYNIHITSLGHHFAPLDG